LCFAKINAKPFIRGTGYSIVIIDYASLNKYINQFKRHLPEKCHTTAKT